MHEFEMAFKAYKLRCPSTVLNNASLATTNATSVSSRGRKVLFAEATKEVVDFHFTLFSLPVGTVVSLLSKNGMVGCLGQLYESVENLSDTYLQHNLNKDILLKP
ncbi:hypothetical protein C1H46_009475 [Malus baccata]|uniref:Uncharacterized protein n=1 Tax=Malus baccata TaxID=106549 RepID=A0A540N1D9_MALBA|nr:hypothetical protein C1H46_009475 [Malus baccata]